VVGKGFGRLPRWKELERGVMMEEVKGVGEVGHIVGDRGTGRTWTTRQWSAGVIAVWMDGGRQRGGGRYGANAKIEGRYKGFVASEGRLAIGP